ncbi:hypothetical protein [Aeromonas veronii]|jgi:hypothetical protein|uniref:hypothetical protein n=1 Tax=Aeromonas TaxID=642 RepID=UPI003F66DA30
MKEYATVISIFERLSQIQGQLDQLASEKKDNTDNPQYVALIDEHLRLTAEVGKRFGI